LPDALVAVHRAELQPLCVADLERRGGDLVHDGPVQPGGANVPETPATPDEQTPTTTSPIADDDFDRDGLTNAEEQQLGTDPYSTDTDNDDLYDHNEVSVWHTDPLNADSDGDSYLDGAEVSNGFNPRGEGKLLELPTSTTPEPAGT
jgi:hypothetical protein